MACTKWLLDDLLACKSFCIRDSEIRRVKLGSALGSLKPRLRLLVSGVFPALSWVRLEAFTGAVRGLGTHEHSQARQNSVKKGMFSLEPPMRM